MDSDDFKKSQKDYFDRISSDYEDSVFFTRVNRNHLKKIETIMHHLNLKGGEKILEIGTGTGIHASTLLRKENVTYFGIDISENMLNETKKKLSSSRENFILVVGDAEHLPFKDNTFDGVFCNATLHHLPDPSRGMGEMVRVLKEGKRLVILEPNWMFPTVFLGALLNRMEKNTFRVNKKNLARWASQENLRNIMVSNLPLYTPPIPKSFIPLYEKIDALFHRLPLILSFSICILLIGEK